ncbi:MULTISPECIES: pseudouridine synthase [Pontibacter]|uniref:23S rRNA pseudouridine2604 synthase n=1 Tax=Pontibacter lucknowensis TaxID=1077936 RepID=A0A1N7AQJ5_9BACT|nr:MULTISPECIES: S4 domain-containing protein [Pontibacter]EJF08146.1 pseudouridine synthase family 1 protein [Pontibacter sp. BAB1700]SIR41283.1 23S rRNA pseudouridine2604 synthase [Pontibacter lucknowensis]
MVLTYGNTNATNNMEPKRLNKFISDSGFCSRRDADELIEQGRVTVNGKIPTDPGMKVTPKDKVRIDDEMLRVKQEQPVYLIFNKPANMSATSDMAVRDNVVRAINFPATLEPTAMLEREAEGIIFLSNDGDFVRGMKRADNKYEKEYIVTVDKMITADFLQKISGGGAPVPGEERVNNSVSKETQTRFRITLKPGTDHYLKRMCESLGYKVMHLQRVRFGEFSLAKLPSGHWRVLTPQEVNSLTSLVPGGKGTSSRKTSESSYDRPARGERSRARGGAGSASSSRDGASGANARTGAGQGPARGGRPGSSTTRSSTRGSDSTRRTDASKDGFKRKGSPKAAPGRSAAPKGGSKRGDAPKGSGPKRGR